MELLDDGVIEPTIGPVPNDHLTGVEPFLAMIDRVFSGLLGVCVAGRLAHSHRRNFR